MFIPDPDFYPSRIPDPGSEKKLFRIPDPGVKKTPDPGSGSATLVLSFILVLDSVFTVPVPTFENTVPVPTTDNSRFRFRFRLDI
jgi:hypothetical protein